MNQILITALLTKNDDAIKKISKIIAHEVRNNMEDFHAENLSDKQMRQLNPIVRDAIYNSLTALVNYDKNQGFKNFIDYHVLALPDDWEDPKLYPSLEKAALEPTERCKVAFRSEFLNDQMRIGNLFFNELTGCLEIRASFDFVGVLGSKHKHRDKISAQLRKEGYIYFSALSGYIKR